MLGRRACAKRRSIPIALAVGLAVVVASFSSEASAASNRPSTEVAAAAVPPPKTTVSPAAGRVLGGLTSQHSSVILEISTNAKRIDLLAINLQLTCTSGDQFWTPDGLTHAPLDSHGSISAHETIPPQTSGGTTGGSLTGGTDTFSGKLNRKAATFSGTWRLQLTFSVPSSTPGTPPTTDSCDSGPVTFKAKL